MSFKVLITCPPMINQINVFEKLFHDANIEVTIPEIKQTLTEKEIIDFCRETLAGFKLPKKVVFCDLPKTSTGKIQKFELRKKAKELS